MTFRRRAAFVRAASLFFALASSLILCVGCGKSTPEPSETASATARDGENGESDGEKKSGKNNSDVGSTGLDGESAAAVALGDATARFSEIFAQAENGEVVEDDPTATWDDSLVDEETKRKYSADRATVEPILTPREASDDDASRPKFRLEYRYPANSDLTWEASHRVRKKTSYGGLTKTTETSSTSYRRWSFGDADSDGKVAGEYVVDRMILQQNEEDKEPIDFDSDRDVVVPPTIARFGTERAIAVVLETFKIDPRGVMSNKKKLVAEYSGSERDSNVFVPFPKEEVGVGDVWTVPYTLYLTGADEVTRPYNVVEVFRLENVDEKWATVSFKTTLTSIVDDPVVEGALAERLFSGKSLFDRERGLATRTELTFDKKVVNAMGPSSYLEYSCQVVEKLVPNLPKRDPASVRRETTDAAPETNAEQTEPTPETNADETESKPVDAPEAETVLEAVERETEDKSTATPNEAEQN